MKKTVKDKNGNTIEFEGTPEELAQFEKQIQESKPGNNPKDSKKLLKDVRQILTDEFAKQRCERQAERTFDPSKFTQISPAIPPTITWTGTSTKFPPCAYEQFMKDNPGHQGPLMLYCSCPRCSPSFMVTNPAWGGEVLPFANTNVCTLN